MTREIMAQRKPLPQWVKEAEILAQDLKTAQDQNILPKT